MTSSISSRTGSCERGLLWLLWWLARGLSAGLDINPRLIIPMPLAAIVGLAAGIFIERPVARPECRPNAFDDITPPPAYCKR
jgi:hypothetical protein